MADQATFISPEVFADLQNRIDEDAEAKEQIREILKGLERQERGVLSLLSKVHNTRTAECEFDSLLVWTEEEELLVALGEGGKNGRGCGGCGGFGMEHKLT